MGLKNYRHFWKGTMQMKSEDQIKQFAKKIRIEPDATVDERVLASAKTALAKSTKKTGCCFNVASFNMENYYEKSDYKTGRCGCDSNRRFCIDFFLYGNR